MEKKQEFINMTICIAIAVPDGIALAADSQTTWNRTITHVKEKGTGNMITLEDPIMVNVGWSKMARKLFEVTMGESKYVVCWAGAAILNSKSIYSIFKSLESSYAGIADYDNIIDYFNNGLKEELKKHLRVANLFDTTEFLSVQYILAGYDDADVSKPRIERHTIFSGSYYEGVHNISGHHLGWLNKINGVYSYGGCWIGQTEYVSHVIMHTNPKLPQITGQYELLSLSDAIDYTKFIVDFTCEFQRFAVMSPDCGKPIISAQLTPKDYAEKIVM
jgi:hypothetical protein